MSVFTATAPANIALVKYWGARDLRNAVPNHPSISMTLTACRTTTTVRFSPEEEGPDEVALLDAEKRRVSAPQGFADRVRNHLDRLREEAGKPGRFAVVTENSFPAGAGLASSASGFCALALAAGRALDLPTDGAALSRLARLSGSGSAARSAFGGFVEWPESEETERGCAFPIATEEHWELHDVIALVDESQKKVSSLEGHRRAATSPHYPARLRLLEGRLEKVRKAIRERDFAALAPVVEEEAIELHCIAMTSHPPIFYWSPETVRVLAAVRTMREAGLAAASTMDAGANVHVLCSAASKPQVEEALRALPGVRGIVSDRVGSGPRLLEKPLA